MYSSFSSTLTKIYKHSKCSYIIPFFSIFFLTFSCTRSINTEKQSQDNEFFSRLLFLEGVAYTIHGSKPITEVVLDRRTQEEKERDKQDYLSSLSEEMKTTIDEQEKISWEPKYDFENSWDAWEKALELTNIHDYLISHVSREQGHLDFVYFVNILETAKALQSHYSLFKTYVGFDFDPLEVTLEFGEESSLFWKTMFEASTSPEQVCLWGILFGYSFENSYPYSWIFRDKDQSKTSNFIDHMFNKVINNPKPLDFKHLSSQDFPLPGFISFSEEDGTSEKHAKERERIKCLYKGKNIEDVFIKKLYGKK